MHDGQVHVHLKVHADEQSIQLFWTRCNLLNSEHARILELRHVVQINRLILQKEMLPGDLEGNLLLNGETDWDPLDVALAYDRFSSILQLVESNLVAQKQDMLLLEKLVNFFLTLAVISLWIAPVDLHDERAASLRVILTLNL